MLQRRKILVHLSGCFTLAVSGCGTLLHSERIGRPHSNEIDWKVAALNGLGLMLFFVPGVVAFAVDFYNGTIYLPYGSSRTAARKTPQPSDALTDADGEEATDELKRISFCSERLTAEQLEALLSAEIQQPVSLQAEATRVSELEGLDRFAQQCRAHHRNSGFGFPLRSLINGQG